MKRLGLITFCFALGMLFASCNKDSANPKPIDPVNPDTLSPAPVNPDTLGPTPVNPTITLKDSLFWGSWGVEKIEYYNIDYAGNPIEASMETFEMIPGDPQSGIDLIFRQNKTGEMRDRSQDTIWTDWNPQTQQYETMIICPDTTLVNTFTYHVDGEDSTLYLNMDYAHTFKMGIQEITDSTFIYTNEYSVDFIERAYLVRLSDTKKAASKQNAKRPNKTGAFLGERRHN